MGDFRTYVKSQFWVGNLATCLCVNNGVRKFFWGPGKTILLAIIGWALFFGMMIGGFMIQNHLTRLENERAEAACRTLRSLDLKSKTPEAIKVLIESQLKSSNVKFKKILVHKSRSGTSFTVDLRTFYVIVFGNVSEYLNIPAGLDEFERTECDVQQSGGFAL